MTDRAEQETALVLAELAKLPMEAAMGVDHLSRLAALGHFEQHPAGAIVLKEGGAAVALRIVLDGRIALLIGVPTAEPTVVGTVERGDLLGWSALRPDAHWQASARAMKPSRCLAFPSEELRTLCENDHELGFYIMRHAYLDLARRHMSLRIQLLDVYGTG